MEFSGFVVGGLQLSDLFLELFEFLTASLALALRVHLVDFAPSLRALCGNGGWRGGLGLGFDDGGEVGDVVVITFAFACAFATTAPRLLGFALRLDPLVEGLERVKTSHTLGQPTLAKSMRAELLHEALAWCGIVVVQVVVQSGAIFE